MREVDAGSPTIGRAAGSTDHLAADNTQDIRKITAELLNDMNQGVVTAERGDAPDEIYIMTGAAEGVIVKVIKKGRYS